MLLSLLQHLGVTALMAAAVGIICCATRPGPAIRHALWLVVLVKLAMPPVLVVRTPFAWSDLPDVGQSQFWQPLRSSVAAMIAPHRPMTTPAATTLPAHVESRQLSERADANQIPSGTRDIQTTSAAAQPSGTTMDSRSTIIAAAIALWTVGTLLYVALQTSRILRVRRWLRRAMPADRSLESRADWLARRMQLPVVPILVVPGLSSPLIWSVRRPVLLWPAELPAALSDECVDGLIVHELAHVRRRDHWVSWLELVAGAIWWWNPLFWYVRSEVREHAELACDACVVSSLPHGRRSYAEALVAVCDIAAHRDVPVPAVGVSTGSRRVLERRLIMIMRGNTSARLSRAAFAATAITIAAVVPAWAQRATTPALTPTAGVPVVVTPAAAEVAPEPTRRVPATRPVAAGAPAPRQGLPSEAQRLISRFESQQAQIRREADAKLVQQRNDVVRQLDELQDSYTKAGRLDDAAAVHDRIRTIQSDRRSGVPVVAAPAFDAALTGSMDRSFSFGTTTNGATGLRDDLTRFRGQVGDSVALTVTGRTDGSVWGSGIYTDDSSLGTAAVHAGVLREGETGTVMVRVLPGQDHYSASRQNGVRTSDYGEWGGSFRIEGVTATVPIAFTPPAASDCRAATTSSAPAASYEGERQPSLGDLRDHVWESFTMSVVGRTDGIVWGSDIYTDDSSIATAAVHAGVLKPGERGTVKVTLLPGQRRYDAVSRHGVASQEYGTWEGSFRLERVK